MFLLFTALWLFLLRASALLILVLLGFFAVLGGLAVVVAGLIAKSTPVGIIGFVIALAGAFTAISNFSLRQMVGSGAMGSPAGKRQRPGWGDRLERRWDDRNNK